MSDKTDATAVSPPDKTVIPTPWWAAHVEGWQEGCDPLARSGGCWTTRIERT